MRESSNIRINSVSSLILQIVTIVSGLLIPRMILAAFGSEVNGLVSSIGQFLSFFAVMEGGISGVVLAALYRPVVERDNAGISRVVVAANGFLKKLGVGFFLYTIAVAIVYPFTNDRFSWLYSALLVIIISITNFIEYYYAIVPQLIVRADNKVYVYNIVSISFVVSRILITVFCVKLVPNIHLVELMSVLLYIIRPITLNFYINKHFDIDKEIKADERLIKNRWNGFGVCIADIITSNTDIIVLTLMATLKEVSIYTIYLGVVSALMRLINSIGYGYHSLIGQSIAEGSHEKINKYIDQYEFIVFNISGIVYSTCICLIVPFIMIYTKGVEDADYRQVGFAVLLCLVYYLCCVRGPYITVTYASGHFKETQRIGYIEAGINLVLSFIAVKWMGLIGVTIGTLAAILYRYAATLLYLKKNIIYRSISKATKMLIVYSIPIAINLILFNSMMAENMNIFTWIRMGIILFSLNSGLYLGIDMIINRQMTLDIISSLIKRNQRFK